MPREAGFVYSNICLYKWDGRLTYPTGVDRYRRYNINVFKEHFLIYDHPPHRISTLTDVCLNRHYTDFRALLSSRVAQRDDSDDSVYVRV